MLLHVHQQTGVGHVAARIDQRAMAIVDNEELVALDGAGRRVVHQIVEGVNDVFTVIEQLNGHMTSD